MPRARPETVTKPAWARPRARRSAKASPAPEALRAPTMATAGRVKIAGSPRSAMSGGADIDPAQQVRIIRLADPDETGAAARRLRHFALDLFFARKPHRAAAWREPGQRLERGARTAKTIDQSAKGPRPDALAAHETQPIEALRLRKLRPVALLHALCPILVSVPLTSRRILPRCVNQRSAASKV